MSVSRTRAIGSGLAMFVSIALGDHGVATHLSSSSHTVDLAIQATSHTPEQTSTASVLVVPTGQAAAGNENWSEFERLIDLSGPGDGVSFDLDGNGISEQVAWPRTGDALSFIVLDRDGNGSIETGLDLIGRHTDPLHRTGFSALAAFAGSQGKSAVTAGDPQYKQLLLWMDRNRNGRSELGELSSFWNSFYTLGLGFSGYDDLGPAGNRLIGKGWAIRSSDYSGKPSDPVWPVLEIVLATKRP
jgi:hypothetical protein